jgi:hypothetical protein
MRCVATTFAFMRYVNYGLYQRVWQTMGPRHGSRRRYNDGCRCDDCKAAEASYRASYRQRKANGDPIGPKGSVVQMSQATALDPVGPGPVEEAVRLEIADLTQAQARPGLAQTALALARIMDNPKATNQQPAAASKLTEILDKLHKGADARKSRLASVRQMTNVKTG